MGLAFNPMEKKSWSNWEGDKWGKRALHLEESRDEWERTEDTQRCNWSWDCQGGSWWCSLCGWVEDTQTSRREKGNNTGVVLLILNLVKCIEELKLQIIGLRKIELMRFNRGGGRRRILRWIVKDGGWARVKGKTPRGRRRRGSRGREEKNVEPRSWATREQIERLILVV